MSELTATATVLHAQRAQELCRQASETTESDERKTLLAQALLECERALRKLEVTA